MRTEHWFYKLPLRLRSLFSRRRVEQDLDDELQYHLEQKTEEYIAQGLTADDARRAALREMDGLTQRREECRDARGVNFIENTLQDIRYSLRLLRKSPGFTIVAVLTLAMAIGANAVVFSVMNALILRPLDVPQPDTLWGIEREYDHLGGETYPNYLDIRDRNRSFQDLAAYNASAAGLDSGGEASRVWLEEVSGNYFDALCTQPYLGRLIHASDEHGPNSAPYAVLSYGFWHTHFQDDHNVVGRVVQLNQHPFTILGVAPPKFNGILMFFHPSLFVPIVNQEQIDGVSSLNDRANRWVFMAFGHLRRGVTKAQAEADLNSIGAALQKAWPKDLDHMKYTLARPDLYGDYGGDPVRAFLGALMLLAGLILLAACANLGSLFAARAADRSREVAVRLALGARRGRILRTLFTEAILISILGGVIGIWGSVMLLSALSVWRPVSEFPAYMPVNPDSHVYLVALLLTLVSGFLFGAVPVKQVLRTDAYGVIKAGSTAKAGRRITARDLLLGAQIAICALLVTSSLVAVRGFLHSLSSNLGFEPHNAMIVEADLNMAGLRGPQVPVLQRRMIDAVKAVPGVTSVGLSNGVPVNDANDAVVFTDQTADLRPSNAATDAVQYNISPEYFEAARTALLMGRLFSWHDDAKAPRVAVVNRQFARKVFGSLSGALGSYFKKRDGTRIHVVGIVEDGRYQTLTEEPQTAMFLPLLQAPDHMTYMVVRSDRDPQQLAAALRSTLRGLDARLPVYIQTWYQELEGKMLGPRLAILSLGVLGVMGAILAVTGIFGMAAYSVSKRLKELGIRLALGAARSEILRTALRRAVKLLAFGSAAGLALGILASRVLASLVYQATPRDPLVLSGVVLVMALVGVLATWIPAQRALSLDPLTLLREE